MKLCFRFSIGTGMACLIFELAAPANAQVAWQPTFADEFDGTSVDWSHWKSPYAGEQPVINNNEPQAYVPAACDIDYVRAWQVPEPAMLWLWSLGGHSG